MLLKLYKKITSNSGPFLTYYLQRRLKKGKEDAGRIEERRGISSAERPKGTLIWVHAASVGESQSALILIDALNKQLSHENISFLVTSVTVTSATLMAKRLPKNAIHQYSPVDHPDWVRRFLDHWQPNAAFWIESELWPNTLRFLKKRHIPSALINGRLSERSYKRWKRIDNEAREMLSVFDIVLAQTEEHKKWFDALGIHTCIVTDNLKFSASPLPYDEAELVALKKKISDRPVWVYASTHKGEEELAIETHESLLKDYPNLLTIIVPRHPDRCEEILHNIKDTDLEIAIRSDNDSIKKNTQIYIADTLGELGLFYKLTDIAIIGRTFSDDGGGGHNPIEAALLDCATLSGPHYQNQQDLTDQMIDAEAIVIVKEKKLLETALQTLFSDNELRQKLIENGRKFAKQKAGVIDCVLHEIEPLLLKINKPYPADKRK